MIANNLICYFCKSPLVKCKKLATDFCCIRCPKISSKDEPFYIDKSCMDKSCHRANELEYASGRSNYLYFHNLDVYIFVFIPISGSFVVSSYPNPPGQESFRFELDQNPLNWTLTEFENKIKLWMTFL